MKTKLTNSITTALKALKRASTDYFTGSKFSNDEGETWLVEDVIKFAKSNPEYYHKDLSIDLIKHDLSWWQGNLERAEKADTSFPILVLVAEDGSLSIADGLNRVYKALNIEKKKTVPAYVVPTKDIDPLKLKQ